MALSERHLAGPRLVALLCALSLRMRLSRRRSKDVLGDVLGTPFQGWLMSDGCWAYRDDDNRLRCLAHLLRKARGLEESLDRQAQVVGQEVRRCLDQLVAAVHQARDGPPPADLRQLSPWDFLAEVVRERRQGYRAPLLPAAR